MRNNIRVLVKRILPYPVRRSMRKYKLILWKYEQIIFGGIFQRNNFSKYSNGTIFLIGVPEHGNLGDQAIGYAEKNFLSRILKDKSVVYITEYGFYKKYISLKKFLNKNLNSKVLWHGGGNVGEIYTFHEEMRLFAIKHLPNIQFIIMPQTIDYNDSSKKLSYAKRIYNGHNNITFFTREKESYEKTKRYFPNCKSYLVPDIVMTFKPHLEQGVRNGVLLCIRNDVEINTKSKNYIKKIKEILKQNNIHYEVTDTVDEEKYSCEFDKQGEELYNKWKQFSSFDVVITDRLHGMIFSLITNTPCIALDNSTKKVSSYYHTWLEKSKILLIEDNNDMNRIMEYVNNSKKYVTNLNELCVENKLVQLIKNIDD